MRVSYLSFFFDIAIAIFVITTLLTTCERPPNPRHDTRAPPPRRRFQADRMGHAARRRARAQERADGVGGRAECLSEAWLQSGEGGGDGSEALWGGSYGVETLDG